MVEIREENGHGEQSNGTTTPPPPPQATVPIATYVKDHALDSIVFALRALTVFFTIQYILNTGDFQYGKTVYFKAFAAAAATNLLRLYQRMQTVGYPILSMPYFQAAMAEDSAHYLLYCVTFPMSHPVAMALLPILMYAFFNGITYLIGLFRATGYSPYAEKLSAFRTQHTENILTLIAIAEIFNFPIFFGMIFTGKGNIFFPVIYFRFLSLRYVSRRNPYTRIVFGLLKNSLYQVANSPRCPTIVQTLIFKTVGLIQRFTPPT